MRSVKFKNGENTVPNISTSEWKSIHGVEIRLINDKLIITDSEVLDWHLIRAYDKRLIYKRVTLRVEFEPLPDCSTMFYVNGWGGVDLAIVDADGTIVRSRAIEATVEQSDKIFCLTVVFNNSHPSISIGMATDKAVYKGHGHEQFLIHGVSYTVEPLRQSMCDNPLVFVDVGAAGGLQANWLPFLDRLDVTMIEPSHIEASRLRYLFPSFRIIENALFNEPGPQELKITKFPECSSLLEPSIKGLNRYRAAPLFKVVDRVEVRCDRYDTLQSQGLVPSPDAIKLDVQGAEYQVLQGFGDLLNDCIGIELECHFYEIYQDQHLIGELVNFLSKFDLRLRRLDPQLSFDGDIVEVNAFFTKPRAALSLDRALKLDLLEKVWKLSVSDSVLTALKKFE